MPFFKKDTLGGLQDSVTYASQISRLEQKEIERCFARVFSGEEGRKVLAWLQVMTFHRTGGVDSSDAQLRFMEGQRNFMAAILRMIDRGKNN